MSDASEKKYSVSWVQGHVERSSLPHENITGVIWQMRFLYDEAGFSRSWLRDALIREGFMHEAAEQATDEIWARVEENYYD